MTDQQHFTSQMQVIDTKLAELQLQHDPRLLATAMFDKAIRMWRVLVIAGEWTQEDALDLLPKVMIDPPGDLPG